MDGATPMTYVIKVASIRVLGEALHNPKRNCP